VEEVPSLHRCLLICAQVAVRKVGRLGLTNVITPRQNWLTPYAHVLDME